MQSTVTTAQATVTTAQEIKRAEENSAIGCLDVFVALLMAPGLFLFRGFAADRIYTWFFASLTGIASPGIWVWTATICLVIVILGRAGPSSPAKSPTAQTLSAGIVTGVILLSCYFFKLWVQ